ncbi:hypothetical protein SEA_CHERRYONLIM_28 [Gordonia phage CherryonLim]|uniref:Uncharacterized protein n=1 Tax=Gordonia phage CherryonLim TaxID=2652411 RepID=A0A5P8DAN6_9CAUD|nr:hypothetical protein PP994_gp28 [Gordonia phage CherryonLim]QFP95781.1 hypothetical protein SEA_CHERRYONLIM_28 [Gordonia phage CherryonLim]
MSFLIRRNRPKALAEWRDDFDRSDESPVQKPWYIWGGLPHQASIVAQALRFHDVNPIASFGGWSYEHTCFTPSWGVAFYFSGTPGGLAAQPFRFFINKSSWTKVNPNFTNSACVELLYRTPGISCVARIITFSGPSAMGNVMGEIEIPRSVFQGAWNFINVKIDQDKLVRVYLNDSLIINQALPAGYEAGIGSRSVNFASGILSPVSIDRFVLYDQYPPDPPFRVYNWAQEFYDDFNRANSSTVGNGWTQYGVNCGIDNNSFSTTGTTAGGRGIIRDSGITNGVQRVEAIIGGANGPSSAAASCLVLRSNSAGTSALSANFFSNKVYVARLSGTMIDPTMTDLAEQSATFANGDKVAFCTTDDYAWVERNGVTLLSTLGANTIPASQSYIGSRVERSGGFGSNSHSWNDLRIMS